MALGISGSGGQAVPAQLVTTKKSKPLPKPSAQIKPPKVSK